MTRTNKLFTLYIEFDGGSYLAQAAGRSPRDAVIRWAGSTDDLVLVGLDEAFRFTVSTQLADVNRLHAVYGLRNVWAHDFDFGDQLAVFHVIETTT
jgi:hypothetical protein